MKKTTDRKQVIVEIGGERYELVPIKGTTWVMGLRNMKAYDPPTPAQMNTRPIQRLAQKDKPTTKLAASQIISNALQEREVWIDEMSGGIDF